MKRMENNVSRVQQACKTCGRTRKRFRNQHLMNLCLHNNDVNSQENIDTFSEKRFPILTLAHKKRCMMKYINANRSKEVLKIGFKNTWRF